MTRGTWILLTVAVLPALARGLYAPPEGGFAETPSPVDLGLGAVVTTGGRAPGFMHRALDPLFWLWKNWLTGQNASICRYTPTCSNHAYQAVSKHGPVRGVTLAFGRLLRCHNHIPPARYPVIYYDYWSVLEALGLPRFEVRSVWEPLSFAVFGREARGHLLDPVP